MIKSKSSGILRHRVVWPLLGALVIVSCGGGSSGTPHSVNVTVRGLKSVSGLVLQNNGTDNLSINTSGRFSFATQVSNGVAYSVSISAQPSGHTCFVTNGNGVVANADVEVGVVCPWHMAYVIFPPSVAPPNTIAAFYIDQATGALTASAMTPLATGSSPMTVVVNPNGKYCYVTNADGTVSAYTIDPVDGTLTAVAGSPFAAGTAPASLAVSPNGRFVYVANQGSANVSAYSVDVSTGALVPISGSPYPDLEPHSAPDSIVIDPTGSYAFVSNGPNESSNWSYPIDPVTGALNDNSISDGPYGAGAGSNYLTFAPNTNFMYESDNSGNIAEYQVNLTYGDTIPLLPQPILKTISDEISNIQIDVSGRFLYVPNLNEGQILGFTRDLTTGELTQMVPPQVPALRGLITIDPAGAYIYATASDGKSDILGFTINQSTGALTQIANASTDATLGGIALAISALAQ
jgi:6-phosphogluconolactonase (cycloisomerase 2 family)